MHISFSVHAQFLVSDVYSHSWKGSYHHTQKNHKNNFNFFLAAFSSAGYDLLLTFQGDINSHTVVTFYSSFYSIYW